MNEKDNKKEPIFEPWFMIMNRNWAVSPKIAQMPQKELKKITLPEFWPVQIKLEVPMALYQRITKAAMEMGYGDPDKLIGVILHNRSDVILDEGVDLMLEGYHAYREHRKDNGACDDRT